MASGEFATCERRFLGVAGVIGAIVAPVLWIRPGTRMVIMPGCAFGQCTVEISADPTALVIVLVGISALLLVIALNGRRLASLKLPGGIEATSLDEQKRAVEHAVGPKIRLISEAPEPGQIANNSEDAPDASPSTTVVVGGVELGVYRLDAVPCRVLADLLKAEIAELPELFAVEFIARKSGRGNHSWLIKFRGDDRIWKIAYGGQGKGSPTVAALE